MRQNFSSDDAPEQGKADLLQLTPEQQKVVECLNGVETEKYPLSRCYLGAISTLKNIHNPDRHAQAAHSLRELIEKISYIMNSSMLGFDPCGKREKIGTALHKAKRRYDGSWCGKSIDIDLEKLLLLVEEYIEQNNLITRNGKITGALCSNDPLFHVYTKNIQNEKRKFIKECWKDLEFIAHHSNKSKSDDIFLLVERVESIIIGLFSNTVSKDQKYISDIISQKAPSESDIQSVLEKIEKFGANYQFFFINISNPLWIGPLKERGCFTTPMPVQELPDNTFTFPFWLELRYLARVANEAPDEVVDIILHLPQTNNPRVYEHIVEAARNLPAEKSAKLLPKVLESTKLEYQFLSYIYVDILEYWVHNGCYKEALKLLGVLTKFQESPEDQEPKAAQHTDSLRAAIRDEPKPIFDSYDYEQVLEKAGKPLSIKKPFAMAILLTEAVNDYIIKDYRAKGRDITDGEDFSDIWCERLNVANRYTTTQAKLVQTLVFACEQVFQSAPADIEALERSLHSQRWKIFQRIRQYLYAKYPNNQTLPWIRECILCHPHYAEYRHHYDFQHMLRIACETFGTELLNDVEQKQIFDAILSGPSESKYKAWMGNEYTDDAFHKWQKYFWLSQLRPFASLLSGTYLEKYKILLSSADSPITDESYPPSPSKCRSMMNQSPVSLDSLSGRTDDDILLYIDEWNDPHQHPDDWAVEINFTALAGEFQRLFSTVILPDKVRLDFWLSHKSAIKRPIYIRSILQAMGKDTQENAFANIDTWLDFCAWVLEQPNDPPLGGQPSPSEESADYPCWRSARRAVLDLVDQCVRQEPTAPLSIRAKLASLLDTLCTQFDWRLDCEQPVILDKGADQVAEAINNTRSRALETLVYFALWVRRQLPDDPVSELSAILSKRLADDAQYPLKRPEYALLGMQFNKIYFIDKTWCSTEKEKIFPRHAEDNWKEAFGAFIRYSDDGGVFFDLLCDDYSLAIKKIGRRAKSESLDDAITLRLGQHIFTYYLWGKYSLDGKDSLLPKFYNKTSNTRKHWAELFNDIGWTLAKSSKDLEKAIVARVVDFFDWRLKAAEPEELMRFDHWLSAECLPAEWRLNSFLKVLDVGVWGDIRLSTEIDSLYALMAEHEVLAMRCFLKITEKIKEPRYTYFDDKAKEMLFSGLKSTNGEVKNAAEKAQENLLRLGHFQFMNPE